MTIIFDSGIRTGSDIFKALALGAHAVEVGRLYVWGMTHEGETGCRHVMKSLLAVSLVLFLYYSSVMCILKLRQKDLDITMSVAGYRSITKDVHRNKNALRYNPSGMPPPKGEHAKL